MARVAPLSPTDTVEAGEALLCAMEDPSHSGDDLLQLLRTLVIQSD